MAFAADSIAGADRSITAGQLPLRFLGMFSRECVFQGICIVSARVVKPIEFGRENGSEIRITDRKGQPVGSLQGAERWTICKEGYIHWGTKGGAGFVFCYVPQEGEPQYLLLQRSRWVDYGGTWGIPGGAIRDGENPEAAARRETQEEIGCIPQYRVARTEVQECGGWKFHVLIADVDAQFEALCGRDADATGWFTKEEMCCLFLHPGILQWLG